MATFTNLYGFGAIPNDGSSPGAGLAIIGGTLFGTTYTGGSGHNGTIFSVSVNGAGYTNVYNFSATSSLTNTDGANPNAALTVSGNLLYGTAYNGGAAGNGTIFRMGTNGLSFTNLYSFSPLSNSTNRDGQNPQASLTIVGNTLYGTAGAGGSGENGTVFRINTDGTGFTNLHSFSASTSLTNSDGIYPSAGLLLAGGILYGTTRFGGDGGNGVIFAIATNGTGFTNLYSFSTLSSASANFDGANPQASLILSGSNLFGTTANGGEGGYGTVFRLSTNGTGFTNLYSFSPLNSVDINADGAYPSGSMLLAGNTLYGTALEGGSGGNGTIFKINTDGTGFSTLYSFMAISNGSNTNADGANPSSGLILSSNTLFSTAGNGGLYGEGTVFSLRVLTPVPLAYQILNHAMVLSWTNPVFSLQTATNLHASFSTIGGATSPYTNALGSGQKYFRLQGR